MSIQCKQEATLCSFNFVSSACNHCFNISWKSSSINSRNFEILIQAERCSLVHEHRNLVQINFIKLNDHSTSAINGGINAASVRIFIISPWWVHRFDEYQDFSIYVLLLFQKLLYLLLITYVFVKTNQFSLTCNTF